MHKVFFIMFRNFSTHTHNSLELLAVWWGLKSLSTVNQGSLIMEGDSVINLSRIIRKKLQKTDRQQSC